MIDTTVVISNYNYSEFLSSAIESCLKQTDPCKIIVVDDFSTDKSWSVIRRHSDRVFGVRLKNNSGGNARGKNVGICLCNTKYVACLDSDDLFLPNSLSVRKPWLDSYDWVHGKAMRLSTNHGYDHIMRRVRRKKYSTWTRYNKYKNKLAETHVGWYSCVEASTVLAKKEAYEKVGLYDEDLRWKIDREMWHRLLCSGVRKKFIDDFVSVYRHHPGQVSRDRKRKNPKLINEKFKRITDIRKKGLSKKNTLFMDNYDVDSLILTTVGNNV